MVDTKTKNYIWNAVAGLINASEVVIMSIIVTRFGRLSDAGIISLAFAIGNVLMTVGCFGGRMFQVTDYDKKYSLKTYLIQRVFTVALMLLFLLCIVLINNYPQNKKMVIAIVTIVYATESIEECIWGFFQSRDRLYLGAGMFCLRWCVLLCVFLWGMVLFSDMVKALVFSLIANIMVFAGCLIMSFQFFGEDLCCKSSEIDTTTLLNLKMLFKQTLPLFISSFCAIFVSNVSKFAIDWYLRDEDQACYSFVAMPVFISAMFNQFMYQPTIVKLTREFCEGRRFSFRHSVKRQTCIIICVSSVCVLGAGLIGIPVLSLLYDTNLANYWLELVILQGAGGFLSLSWYFSVVLTIMRKQNYIMWGYLIILLASIPILFIIVRIAGVMGAAVGFLISMIGLLAIFLSIYYKYINE